MQIKKYFSLSLPTESVIRYVSTTANAQKHSKRGYGEINTKKNICIKNTGLVFISDFCAACSL